jgi:nitrate reductase NapE component
MRRAYSLVREELRSEPATYMNTILGILLMLVLWPVVSFAVVCALSLRADE